MITILTLMKSTQTLLICTLMTLVIGKLTQVMDIPTLLIDFEILVLRMLTLGQIRLCISTLVMDIY